MFFLFYSFTCDFLEFPLVKSSHIFTAYRFLRDTNFKDEKSRVCKGGFFDFCKFTSLTAARKLVVQISLKNELRLK